MQLRNSGRGGCRTAPHLREVPPRRVGTSEDRWIEQEYALKQSMVGQALEAFLWLPIHVLHVCFTFGQLCHMLATAAWSCLRTYPEAGDACVIEETDCRYAKSEAMERNEWVYERAHECISKTVLESVAMG